MRDKPRTYPEKLWLTLLYWWYVCTTDVDPEFIYHSLMWQGRLLRGQRAHFCPCRNGFPIDETCPEYPCGCVWIETKG